MNTSMLICGANYKVEADQISLWDTHARKQPTGRWFQNDLGDKIYTEIRPANPSGELARRINIARDRGNQHRIFAIQISPRTALVYYSKGFLTMDHFAAATEGVGFIDIPGIAVDDHELAVLITQDMPRDIAVTDKQGNFLCGPRNGRCLRLR